MTTASAVSSSINEINNEAAKAIAASNTTTGSASCNLTTAQFLNLIIAQLQYQDPMEPTDNSQFVSQTCQLSQLESTQDNTATSVEQQAASLVGENVTLTNPDDDTETITGTVTAATIDGDDSAITVNGTSYPLKYLQKVNQETTTDSTGSTSSSDSTSSSSSSASASGTSKS